MDRTATMTANVFDGPFEVVAVACGENHASANFGRLLRRDETDTARRAGNDDDLFVKRLERCVHECLVGSRLFISTAIRTGP